MIFHIVLPDGDFGLGIFKLDKDENKLDEAPIFSVTRQWLDTKIAEAQFAVQEKEHDA
jgi:hypothetical protein